MDDIHPSMRASGGWMDGWILVVGILGPKGQTPWRRKALRATPLRKSGGAVVPQHERDCTRCRTRPLKLHAPATSSMSAWAAHNTWNGTCNEVEECRSCWTFYGIQLGLGLWIVAQMYIKPLKRCAPRTPSPRRPNVTSCRTSLIPAKHPWIGAHESTLGHEHPLCSGCRTTGARGAAWEQSRR